MTDEKRALELYDLALSVVEAKGVVVTVGSVAYTEYRAGTLTIIYLPTSGHLDVWSRRKVLTINRRDGTLKADYYSPGDWEEQLEDAAAESR